MTHSTLQTFSSCNNFLSTQIDNAIWKKHTHPSTFHLIDHRTHVQLAGSRQDADDHPPPDTLTSPPRTLLISFIFFRPLRKFRSYFTTVTITHTTTTHESLEYRYVWCTNSARQTSTFLNPSRPARKQSSYLSWFFPRNFQFLQTCAKVKSLRKQLGGRRFPSQANCINEPHCVVPNLNFAQWHTSGLIKSVTSPNKSAVEPMTEWSILYFSVVR